MPEEDVLDWLVQDELEELQEQYLAVEHGGEVAIDEAFDDDRVEMHLRCLSHHDAKFRALQKQATQEIEKIGMKLNAATAGLTASIRYHTENLMAFGQSLGETYKGLNGKIKRTAGRDSILCEEEEDRKKFYAWCEETGNLDTLTRVKPEERNPDKKEIAKFIKTQGGELPPGVDLKTGDDSYKIELS